MYVSSMKCQACVVKGIVVVVMVVPVVPVVEVECTQHVQSPAV